MSHRGWFLGSALAVFFAASTAFAAGGVRIAAATAAEGVDARARSQFQAEVEKAVTSDASAAVLDGYTLLPNLVQLRRYVDSSTKAVTQVCVVELSVVDTRGNLVGKTRGSASGATSAHEVMEVATVAAAGRLSGVLAALVKGRARRVAERD